MEISTGSFDLIRTNPAHIGSGPIVKTTFNLASSGKVDPVGKVSRNTYAPEVNGASGSGSSFKSLLLDAVNQMNAQQVEVSKIQEKVVTDPDSVDIHDVTVAMAKAKMSLDLAQTVIDRLVSGWTELSQNR